MYFDTHAHYDDRAFDADREALLQSLGEGAVKLIIDPGCDVLSSRKALELAERFAQAVKEDINPRDSWRAAKDFRMHIAVESARRAFIEAVKLAGGDL